MKLGKNGNIQLKKKWLGKSKEETTLIMFFPQKNILS